MKQTEAKSKVTKNQKKCAWKNMGRIYMNQRERAVGV